MASRIQLVLQIDQGNLGGAGVLASACCRLHRWNADIAAALKVTIPAGARRISEKSLTDVTYRCIMCGKTIGEVKDITYMKILLAGNTGYLTEPFIQAAFPGCRVAVLGNAQIRSNKKNILSLSLVAEEEAEREEELTALFDAYEFDRVVYFSNYLTFHGALAGEMEQLRWILQCCVRRKDIQVVYLAGPEVGYGDATGKEELAGAAERLCMHYRESGGLQVAVLRLLYLYSPTYQDDYICRLLRQVAKGHDLAFREHPGQRAYFLSMEDLASLLYRVFDNWPEPGEILSVPDCFGISFAEVGEGLKKLRTGLSVTYDLQAPLRQLSDNDRVLRYRYGWFPHFSLLPELPRLYRECQEAMAPKAGRVKRAAEWVRGRGKAWRAVELCAVFLLMELLLGAVGNQAQFRMIDFRLLLIVLTGTVYGMDMGIAAAALESLSLVAAYGRQGMNWFTLFYEPLNWIPFIAYFMAGAICGYIRMKSRDELSFVKKENDLIQEKFLFMRGLYMETLKDKREYKKQIIGSRDSFGKIFRITRELDVVRPQEIFIRAIRVMEDVLENRTVAIYSMGRNKAYARLEAASGAILKTADHSIRLADYGEALETLEQGEVWSNGKLLEGYPKFAAGIRRGGRLVLLVFVRDADYTQMSMYYVNLLKILCGLVETALLRALDYQEASRKEQYLPGTNILKERYFLERLQLCHKMREEKMAEYALVRLDRGAMSLEEAEDRLRSKVRENDMVGVTGDGTLYVILTQASREYVPVVTTRLETAGFACTVCSGPAELEP